MLESALHRTHASRDDVSATALRVSTEWRSIARELRSDAESGSESLFRFGMALLGVDARPQVTVPGVGRVDFVIGDRLIVEIDSDAHHGSREQRLRDLGRDAVAAGLGFVALRFDYSHVLNDWGSVESAVLAVVARGEHVARGASPRAARRT
ncbi:endonuclease domain-containing protein [Marisediminicola sp. LYQ134]|uniref:endonuclease domain-containing protein n=1 Tax=Marisediminicola sp. LYQ134 TaxID=3391061 RepID=UPI003982E14E